MQRPPGHRSGYLAAPATFGSSKYGILLTGDTVTSAFADGRRHLGRAWPPSNDAVPRMVVRKTSLPAVPAVWLADTAGWNPTR